MDQIIQVFGSLLILAAFVAAQRGRMTTDSRRYLVLNFVGASILAVLAAYERQFGFLLLEFSWAVVAGYSLIRRRHGGGGDARPARSPASTAAR